eukprot:PhM_4_TR11687/c3_g4_i3/m.76277
MYAVYDADGAGECKGDYVNIGFVLVEPGDQFEVQLPVWVFDGSAVAGKWKKSDAMISQEDVGKRYIRRVELPLSTRRLTQETINEITERGTLHQLGEKRLVALREGKVVTARTKALRNDHLIADVFRDAGNAIETRNVRLSYEHIVIPARTEDGMGDGVVSLGDLAPEQRAELVRLAEGLHRPVARIPMNVAHLRASVERDDGGVPQMGQQPQQQQHNWGGLPPQVHTDLPGTEWTVMLHLLGVAPIGPVRVRLVESGKAQMFCSSLPTLDGRTMTWPPPPMLDGRPMNYEILSGAVRGRAAVVEFSTVDSPNRVVV